MQSPLASCKGEAAWLKEPQSTAWWSGRGRRKVMTIEARSAGPAFATVTRRATESDWRVHSAQRPGLAADPRSLTSKLQGSMRLQW
jgi:hypothetical protein